MAAKRSTSARSRSGRAPSGLSGLVEQLVERVLRPLGLVVLSHERIQETLEEAVERGRITRSDANQLAAQLVQRGRQQTDELLGDIDRLLGLGRQQLDSAATRLRRSDRLDRVVRGADRTRRAVGVGPAFPITGYDELTAPQIRRRLSGLNRSELRKVRSYEASHAKRKTILTRVDSLLG